MRKHPETILILLLLPGPGWASCQSPFAPSPQPVELAQTPAATAQPAIGNWSGSVDGRYRTLRAGLCLEQEEERQFLIYGYFSSATPSAMARVFQAYHCKSAMLTDMNALEHTYLAVYAVRDPHPRPQHLIRGMEVLDKSSQGQVVPRFAGCADNRDFFYLTSRSKP